MLSGFRKTDHHTDLLDQLNFATTVVCRSQETCSVRVDGRRKVLAKQMPGNFAALVGLRYVARRSRKRHSPFIMSEPGAKFKGQGVGCTLRCYYKPRGQTRRRLAG